MVCIKKFNLANVWETTHITGYVTFFESATFGYAVSMQENVLCPPRKKPSYTCFISCKAICLEFVRNVLRHSDKPRRLPTAGFTPTF
jgi:hypothetical protein